MPAQADIQFSIGSGFLCARERRLFWRRHSNWEVVSDAFLSGIMTMGQAPTLRCGLAALTMLFRRYRTRHGKNRYMLKHQLIHPKINEVLGRCGHHSKILIADGNYPASSTLGPNAELVSLNLMPGLVSCTQTLQALLSAIPVEACNTMGIPDDDPYALGGDPPVWNEYRTLLKDNGLDIELTPIQKWDFYDAVASRDLVLTIQTAEQALWANLLLTVGVRQA